MSVTYYPNCACCGGHGPNNCACDNANGPGMVNVDGSDPNSGLPVANGACSFGQTCLWQFGFFGFGPALIDDGVGDTITTDCSSLNDFFMCVDMNDYSNPLDTPYTGIPSFSWISLIPFNYINLPDLYSGGSADSTGFQTVAPGCGTEIDGDGNGIYSFQLNCDSTGCTYTFLPNLDQIQGYFSSSTLGSPPQGYYAQSFSSSPTATFTCPSALVTFTLPDSSTISYWSSTHDCSQPATMTVTYPAPGPSWFDVFPCDTENAYITFQSAANSNWNCTSGQASDTAGCNPCPTYWTFSLSGIDSAAGCSNCTDLNGDWTVSQCCSPIGLVWEQPECNTSWYEIIQAGGSLPACSTSGEQFFLEAVPDSAGFAFTICQCGNQATYFAPWPPIGFPNSTTTTGGVTPCPFLATTNYDCCSPVTFTSNGDCSPCCAGLPDTIVLTPSCPPPLGSLTSMRSGPPPTVTPAAPYKRAAKPVLLGDAVESALSKIGVTSERVSAWLGRPCGCAERRDKLNRLHKWAKGLFGKGDDEAKRELEAMTKLPPLTEATK